jgi:coenzyme F420-0:L-glutamate ligase/coenzyme F420-1:gamma-L-glutamate ligase
VKIEDNLAEMIVETMKKECVPLNDVTIIVIAHKIVSKAEGRIVKLKDIVPSAMAEEIAGVTVKDPRFIELILRETKEIVKVSSDTLVVRNKNGLVCINAGIDKSNVEGSDAYALLPSDPDDSVRRINAQINKLTGKNVSVVICDTYSRPFRRGQTEFTIGIAGINPIKDYHGQRDLFGYILKVKNSAVADEIASAAELLMGQGNEAIPVVIIKNLSCVEAAKDASATELLISEQEDLFKETL